MDIICTERVGDPMSRSASSTQTVALPPRSEAPSSKVQHPTRGKEFADKISVLCIPNGPEHGSIPEGARKVRERGEMPDVVVLTEANAARLMADYLPASAAAIIPVIDTSGEDHRESAWRCEFADLRLKGASAFSLNEALCILKPKSTGFAPCLRPFLPPPTRESPSSPDSWSAAETWNRSGIHLFVRL